MIYQGYQPSCVLYDVHVHSMYAYTNVPNYDNTHMQIHMHTHSSTHANASLELIKP